LRSRLSRENAAHPAIAILGPDKVRDTQVPVLVGLEA
jgi:hypothetical protein